MVGWSRDGRSVFVQAPSDPPATVERMELASGRRTVAGKVMAEEGGLGRIDTLVVGRWVDEGRSVGYSYYNTQSTLFVVSGATAPR